MYLLCQVQNHDFITKNYHKKDQTLEQCPPTVHVKTFKCIRYNKLYIIFFFFFFLLFNAMIW